MYRKKIVFAAACAGMFLFGVSLITLGSLLPFLIKKFALDTITAGSLTALLPLGLLGGSVIFGPFADKYGYKNLFTVFSFIIMISLSLLTAVSNFLLLQFLIFLLGLGSGVLNGSTNALVSDISTDNRTANLNLLGVFYGLGALGMPALLSFLLQYFSYREITTATGLAVIIPVLFFLLIKFPEPKQPEGISLARSFSLAKDPLLLLFGLLLFFQSGMEGLAYNWSTTYLINHGINQEKALTGLSYLILSLTLTRFLLSTALRSISFKHIICVSFFIMLAGSITLLIADNYTAALSGLIILGSGFAPVFPLMFSAVGKIYAAFSGTAFSIILSLSLIGNMILNYLTGIIAHQFGIKYYSILIIISLILVIFIFRVIINRQEFRSFNNFNI